MLRLKDVNATFFLAFLFTLTNSTLLPSKDYPTIPMEEKRPSFITHTILPSNFCMKLMMLTNGA